MKHAFSLVELSIVLVILGLLTGGILTGQSLIRAAELRSVTTELNTIQTAVLTFRGKYFQLPGDMTNATSFWGAEDGGDGLGADCFDVASTTATTCNGNGDGGAGNNSQGYEQFRFWQHLANAGLIEGNYSGVGGSLGTSSNHSGCIRGTNCLESKLGQSTWQFRTHIQTSSHPSWYDFKGGDVLFYGDTDINGTAGDAHGATLSPEEAWNLDKKIDDERPAYGKVRTFKFGTTETWAAETNNCANNATDSLAEYNLTSTDLECAMIFLTE